MWEFSQDSVTSQLKVDQALLNVTSSLNKSLWLYQLSDECVAVSCFFHYLAWDFYAAAVISLQFHFVQCPYKKIRKVPPLNSILERINTQTQLKWSLFNSNVGPYAFDNRCGCWKCLAIWSILNCYWLFFFPLFGYYLSTVVGAACVHSTPICVIEPSGLGQFGIYNLTVNQTGCSFHTHRSPVNGNWCKYKQCRNNNNIVMWAYKYFPNAHLIWMMWFRFISFLSTTQFNDSNHIEINHFSCYVIVTKS